MHPAYASSNFAKSLGLPVLEVQHHHAHIASVMAEHNLGGPVIGVAFDGTGYGADGAVWGGEFLICRDDTFERAGHLKYASFVGGDEMMKDAAKSAMFHLYAAGLEEYIKDERWPVVRAALENNINVYKNSSMGRLFDAVSSIMGVCSYNRFEGECAIDLENLAAEALRLGIKPEPMRFKIEESKGTLLADASPIIASIVKTNNADNRALALGFHRALADMTLRVCESIRYKRGIKIVALSGGVFQNTVLLEDTMQQLKDSGFTVYINENVPPNDGGVCLGQAYIGLKHLQREETTCA
jgi:hydrogenase maturation protein HypF